MHGSHRIYINVCCSDFSSPHSILLCGFQTGQWATLGFRNAPCKWQPLMGDYGGAYGQHYRSRRTTSDRALSFAAQRLWNDLSATHACSYSKRCLQGGKRISERSPKPIFWDQSPSLPVPQVPFSYSVLSLSSKKWPPREVWGTVNFAWVIWGTKSAEAEDAVWRHYL